MNMTYKVQFTAAQLVLLRGLCAEKINDYNKIIDWQHNSVLIEMRNELIILKKQLGE